MSFVCGAKQTTPDIQAGPWCVVATLQVPTTTLLLNEFFPRQFCHLKERKEKKKAIAWCEHQTTVPYKSKTCLSRREARFRLKSAIKVDIYPHWLRKEHRTLAEVPAGPRKWIIRIRHHKRDVVTEPRSLHAERASVLLLACFSVQMNSLAWRTLGLNPSRKIHYGDWYARWNVICTRTIMISTFVDVRRCWQLLELF